MNGPRVPKGKACVTRPVGLRAVIRAALAAAPHGLTIDELGDACYARGSAPLTWSETVRGQIRRLRPVLRAEGLDVVRLAPYGPRQGPYALCPYPGDAA